MCKGYLTNNWYFSDSKDDPLNDYTQIDTTIL